MLTLSLESILAILVVLYMLILPVNMHMADAALDIKIQAEHILDVSGEFGSTRKSHIESIEDYLDACRERDALAVAVAAHEFPERLDKEFVEEMMELMAAAEIVKNSPDGIYYSYEQMVESGAAFSPLKPARSPNLPGFFVSGGRCITIFNNGACWLFDADVETSAKGLINVKVLYVLGHVIFPDNAIYHKIPETEWYIDIGPFGTREADNLVLTKVMHSLGMTKIPKGYVKHHSAIINGYYEFVLKEVHTKFTHNGGHYFYGCD